MTVADLYDETVADKVRVQYGGSVKPANVKELMAKNTGESSNNKRFNERLEIIIDRLVK